MAADHADVSVAYLASTQSVLRAARRLRGTLGADASRRNFAITQLQDATQQQQIGATGYRSFMFSELGMAETESVRRERVAEATLASISADLHVANVLIAAGETVGETGAKAAPRILDEAILRLENTTQAIERSLSSPLAAPKRFGFAEDVTSPQPVTSPDLSSATENFRRHTEEALNGFVSEAQGAVRDIVETLSNISGEKVVEAVSRLGGAIGKLPSIGRLISQGVEKLVAAINALTRLMGNKALAGIKDKVGQFLQDAQKGKPLQELLKWAFGVETAQSHVAEVLQMEGLKLESLDEGSTALKRLPAMFKENMGIVTSLAFAVTLTGTLLSVVPAIGANAVLVAASIDVLILASIILIGRDYTDSGDMLRRVRGVREIVDEVRSAQVSRRL
jgi:hypothetical protein